MSGRLVSDTRVKAGEILPMDVTQLANEEQQEIQRSAEMRAIYLAAHKLGKVLTKHYGNMLAEPRMVVEAESDVEEKKDIITARERYLSRRKAIKEMKAPTAGEKHIYAAKNRDTLRKDILSVSLFPNLYNHKSLLAGM